MLNTRKLQCLKSTISFMLALIMVLSLCLTTETVNVKAASSDFVIKNGVLTSYKGTATKVTVPEGVEAIGDLAFAQNSNIETVILPEGLTEIRQYAFYACEKLTKVTFPESLASIENSAFQYTALRQIKLPEGLSYLGESVFGACGSLERVTLGSKLTEIPASAFEYCTNLNKVALPSELKSIGAYAFKGTALTAITLPDSLTTIGNSAFAYCGKLADVKLNSELKLIGIYAFSDTAWLQNLQYDENGYKITEGILFEAPQNEKNPVIPSTVRIIAGGTFKYSWLNTVEIHDSVIAIGNRAFDGCSELKAISIPDSVKYIGDEIFAGCTALENIKLPSELIYRGADLLPEQSFTFEKITDSDAKNVVSLLKKGYPVTVYIPIAYSDNWYTDSENYSRELVAKVSQASGLACFLDYSDSNITTTQYRSWYYNEFYVLVHFSDSCYALSEAASKKLLKSAKTVKIGSVSDSSVEKLSKALSNNKSILLKVKSTKGKLNSKLNQINKKLKKLNKAGVILRFDFEDNCYISGEKKYNIITNSKNGYCSLVITAETVKTYNLAVTFVNKIFERAKKNAYSDSQYGSEYSGAKKILSNANCMNDLSDAMKVYAIATSAYFRGDTDKYSFCMEYDLKSSYVSDSYTKDSEKLKIMNDGKARGVCYDFAVYEMLVWSSLGIENYFNESNALNHGWSVVKVTNSAGKEMWIPFDYDIGPNPLLSGFHYNVNNAEQVANRYKIYLKGVPGAPESKNFTAADFK